MKYTYKNKKTGEVKEYKKVNQRLEKSPKWKRTGFLDKMFRIIKTK
jgi:hypothetical protein